MPIVTVTFTAPTIGALYAAMTAYLADWSAPAAPPIVAGPASPGGPVPAQPGVL